MCIRCHSPNAWLGGRTDPQLGGMANASNLVHSILASTDDEGIMCESCHRVIGGVTQQRADLDPADPVWNMLAGIDDWPHQGNPYPQGPLAGMPYGDSTLQFNDGMTYAGKYSGSVKIHFSDTPLAGTNYTGQTYAVYPDDWPTTPGEVYYAPDGTVPIHFEEPIGPPLVGGVPDNQLMALSLEHPTTMVDFIRSPRFCGSCHDLTVPVLNHGMPEQRTYTEWRFSDFGRNEADPSYRRCQDCHMPTLMHEYSDDAPVSLNPDPVLAGWFPYGKDRNPQGGTTFHKLVGANRDLPDMLKLLYPEVDLEIIGAPTGNDVRIFPGMLSDRSTMWDRGKRNTELSLNSAVDVEVVTPPTETGTPGVYEMQVKVTNTSGHRIPSGYPDGRRFWLSVEVTNDDDGDATVYESGVYDQATATLYNDSNLAGFDRALVPTIDATSSNAVMVYEKLTGSRGGGGVITQSPNILNDLIVFDNRIPPAGFTYADYQVAGAKFIVYNPADWEPTEDVGRYPDGQNWDLVTYRFNAPTGVNLSAKAGIYWQTHNRQHMEHLKDNDTSEYKPEGPPSVFAVNYPLTPTYLWDHIPAAYKTDLGGQPLRNNWGGVAYAAWLATGKGAPLLAAADNTKHTAVPDAPTGLAASVVDAFTLDLNWNPVANAEGYILWVRYGISETTASWDKLAMLPAGTTTFRHEALNVGKTYGYRVAAFNGEGSSPFSTVIDKQTPTDLPLAPTNLQVLTSTETSITLTWLDQSDNEDEFIVQRQDAPAQADFYEVARVPTLNQGGVGGQTWTDTTVEPGKTYNYRVAASNASGQSTWTLPVQGSTLGAPTGTITLNGTPQAGLNYLDWSGATGTIEGYRLYRSTVGATGPFDSVRVLAGDAAAFNDNLIDPDTDYWYYILAFNNSGETAPSNTVAVHSLPFAAAAPTGLNAQALDNITVRLTWSDRSDNEVGFRLERRVLNTGNFVQIWDSAAANVTTYDDSTGINEDTSYEYRVYAYNATGDSAFSNVAAVYVPVSGTTGVPNPEFSATPTSGGAPLTVVFGNLTTADGGGPADPLTTYLWEFGDGATSTEQHPTHIYTIPGTYMVTLTATVTGAFNKMIKPDYIQVNPGGSLRVTLNPTPVPTGAQWRVDGGAWQNSEAVVGGLDPALPHAVDFATAAGYVSPGPQVVNVTHGLTTHISATYTAEAGSIRGVINPAAARTFGRWRVDGGAWMNHNDVVSNLSTLGNHTVEFNNIPGYTSPVSLSVAVSNGATSDAIGNYTLTGGATVNTTTLYLLLIKK